MPDQFCDGAIVAGKLRIVRLLGSGGLGSVYEIEHTLTRHRRALKLLHPEMAAQAEIVERFLREASAAGRIGNPHIVETFDAGRLDTGEPYILMELLDGEPLANRLQRVGKLSLVQTCEIVKQTCEGVAAAHAAGIVHRDIKPENLFLVGVERSFVKVLDFGVSKFDTLLTGVTPLTEHGSPIGTPSYMAPEQLRGELGVDARSDVYALGVLLYECLTGQKPFVAETLPHLAVLIHEGIYRKPSELRPDLPPEVDALIARCLARDPERRPATAAEIAAELETIRRLPPRTNHDETAPGLAAPDALAPTLLRESTIEARRGGSPQPREPQRRSRTALVVAGVGLAAALVAYQRLRAPALVVPPPAPSRPATQVVPEPPLESAKSAAPSSTIPAASASAAELRTLPRPSRPAPATSASATRARLHGLSERNPFE